MVQPKFELNLRELIEDLRKTINFSSNNKQQLNLEKMKKYSKNPISKMFHQSSTKIQLQLTLISVIAITLFATISSSEAWSSQTDHQHALQTSRSQVAAAVAALENNHQHAHPNHHHHHHHQQLQQQQHSNQHHHQHHSNQRHMSNNHNHASLAAIMQARAGGLDPSDYVDEASELDIMSNSQTIPTAQLLAAAGHIVPDNFFLPGTSIPATLFGRLQQQQQQQAQAQHQHQQQQQHAGHATRPSDLLEAASAQELAAAAAAAAVTAAGPESIASLIDYNSQQQQQQRDLAQQQQQQQAGNSQHQVDQTAASQQDMIDLVNGGPSSAAAAALLQNAAAYEQQQQLAEHQIAAELAAMAALQREHQHQSLVAAAAADQSVQASDLEQQAIYGNSQQVGPSYQIDNQIQQQQHQQQQQQQRPYGLPTKSSDREPVGMLKPMGNPKTITSPVIDLLATQVLPKTQQLDKFVGDKVAANVPQAQPLQQAPTIFSFNSQRDPIGDKTKAVNQKKRNVMKQAENFYKMFVKTVNDKFGINLNDQTDIPFLLSSVGPLGFAQNVLLDPTLINTLLNTAEKTYMSDILPSPAKLAMRPVLNIFRVPNKKRDNANLSNIISFLASGGQMPASGPKHRQGTGIEKHHHHSSKNSKH